MRGDNRYAGPKGSGRARRMLRRRTSSTNLLSPGPLGRAARTSGENRWGSSSARAHQELQVRRPDLGSGGAWGSLADRGWWRPQPGRDRPDAAHEERHDQRRDEGRGHLSDEAEPHVRLRERPVRGEPALGGLQQEEGAHLKPGQAKSGPARRDPVAEPDGPSDRLPEQDRHDQGSSRRQRPKLPRVVLPTDEQVGELVAGDDSHQRRDSRPRDTQVGHGAGHLRAAPAAQARRSQRSKAHLRIIAHRSGKTIAGALSARRCPPIGAPAP